MNISAISPMTKRAEDFNNLQSTLQSGNIAAAQGAFAAFLQDVQKTNQLAGPGNLFSPGSQASKDLQALGGALHSADLAGARKAFSTLQQDLQSAAPGGNQPHPIHANRPLTHAEIVNNGMELRKPSLQAAGAVLNTQA